MTRMGAGKQNAFPRASGPASRPRTKHPQPSRVPSPVKSTWCPRANSSAASEGRRPPRLRHEGGACSRLRTAEGLPAHESKVNRSGLALWASCPTRSSVVRFPRSAGPPSAHGRTLDTRDFGTNQAEVHQEIRLRIIPRHSHPHPHLSRPAADLPVKSGIEPGDGRRAGEENPAGPVAPQLGNSPAFYGMNQAHAETVSSGATIWRAAPRIIERCPRPSQLPLPPITVCSSGLWSCCPRCWPVRAADRNFWRSCPVKVTWTV